MTASTRTLHTVTRLEGLNLYLRSSGPEDSPRPAIFWIHGLGESGLCFEHLLAHPRLAPRYQIALDMPGYGKSPWLAQAKTLPELAGLLARWLDQHHPQPVVVIGHSMGGVIGQFLCEQHPESVAGFVNVEGNQSLGDCGFSSRANALSHEEFISSGFDKLCQQLFKEALAEPALRTYYPSVRLCDPSAFHLNSTELVQLSNEEKLARRMAALDLGTHYVYGSPDGAAERSQALIREVGVSSSAIEPAGHWPFLDRPEDFLDVLVALLDSFGT